MFVDLFYLAALLFALFTAFRFNDGRMVMINPTAAVLVGGAAVAAALPVVGIPFDDLMLVAIDMAMIVMILRGHYSSADSLIVALFVPCWALYPVDQDVMVTIIAALQFLLASPIPRLIQGHYVALTKKRGGSGGHFSFRPVSTT
jgi:hypothetical protein